MSNSSPTFKDMILGALVLFSSLAAFWMWRGQIAVILTGHLYDYQSLIVPAVSLGISAALFAFGMLFINNSRLAHGAAIGSISIPFFLAAPDSLILGTLLLGIYLIIFSVRRIQSEYQTSINFSAARILRDGLPLYFTAASLVISVFYLQELSHGPHKGALVPQPALNYTIQILGKNSPIAKSFDIPEIDPQMTVDDLIKSFLRKEAEKRGVAWSYAPAEEVNRLVAEERNAIATQYNISLEGNEKVGEVLGRAMQSYMNRLLGPYQVYLPFAAAAAFFLAFKTLTVPLYYLTLLAVYILIKVLIWSNILQRKTEKIEVERLVL